MSLVETPNPAQGKPVIPYVDYASSNAEQRANTRMTYEISEAEPRIKKSEKYKDISTNFEEKFKDISGDWSLSKSLFPDTHKESVLHKALLVQAKLLNLALTNKETAQSIVSKIGEEGVSFNENEQKILTAISEIFASKNLNSDSKLKDQLKDQLMEGLHFFKDDQFKIATTIPSESQIMILVNNKQSIEEILRICGQIPRDPSKKIDANNLHSLIRATFIWKAHEEFEKQNSSILGGGSDATVAANAPAHSPDSGAGVCEGGLGAPAGAPAPVAVVAGGATASAPSATPANTSDGFANAVDKTKAEGRNLIGSA